MWSSFMSYPWSTYILPRCKDCSMFWQFVHDPRTEHSRRGMAKSTTLLLLLLCFIAAEASRLSNKGRELLDDDDGGRRVKRGTSARRSNDDDDDDDDSGSRRSAPAQPAPVPVRPVPAPVRPVPAPVKPAPVPVQPVNRPFIPPSQPGFGFGSGAISGFIVVYALGDGRMCYTGSTGSIDSGVQQMGADTFVEVYGTLEGSAECAPGARGFGIAVLTGQAFVEVLRIGDECKTRTGSNTSGFSTVFGQGIGVGVSGGFGASGGCPPSKTG